jgi:hypothetical protein
MRSFCWYRSALPPRYGWALGCTVLHLSMTATAIARARRAQETIKTVVERDVGPRLRLRVALKVKMREGRSWGELHENTGRATYGRGL